jgi:hypothetical protein
VCIAFESVAELGTVTPYPNLGCFDLDAICIRISVGLLLIVLFLFPVKRPLSPYNIVTNPFTSKRWTFCSLLLQYTSFSQIQTYQRLRSLHTLRNEHIKGYEVILALDVFEY